MTEKNRKKTVTNETARRSRVLPAALSVFALILILLPMEKPVNSARVLLAYVFIPQIRAAHSVTQYLNGVNETISALLETADGNSKLKEEITRLEVRSAQLEAMERENARLADALNVSAQKKWRGVWAKVAYREPSKRSTVIADKGSDDGIELRAPVLAVEDGVVGLAGKVIGVTAKASKILLINDEEFSASAFLSQSGAEGLATGSATGRIGIKYIPFENGASAGEKVYTSASSALFPDGILIGEVVSLNEAPHGAAFLMPGVKVAVDPGKIKEVFIMPAMEDKTEDRLGK